MIESIGIAQLAVASAHVSSPPPSVNSGPVILPNPVSQAPDTDQINFSTQAAQQQPVQQKVEYANPQVLGTQAVTMYMVNGQLYTRYRDEVTNKVTYIPNEAQILGSNSDSTTPVLNITA